MTASMLSTIRRAAGLSAALALLMLVAAPAPSWSRPSRSLQGPFNATMSLTGSFEVNETIDTQPQCDFARTLTRKMTTRLNVPPTTMASINPAGFSPGGATKPIANAYTHETVVLADTGRVYRTGPTCPYVLSAGPQPAIPVCAPTSLPMRADTGFIENKSAPGAKTVAVTLAFISLPQGGIDAACQAEPRPTGVWPLFDTADLQLLTSPDEYSELRAPLALTTKQLGGLKPGRTIKNTVTVSGPCAQAVLTPWPGPQAPPLLRTAPDPNAGPANACTVSGSYTVSFTRLPVRKRR